MCARRTGMVADTSGGTTSEAQALDDCVVFKSSKKKKASTNTNRALSRALASALVYSREKGAKVNVFTPGMAKVSVPGEAPIARALSAEFQRLNINPSWKKAAGLSLVDLEPAILSSGTMAHLRAGFRRPGIFPFDPSKLVAKVAARNPELYTAELLQAPQIHSNQTMFTPLNLVVIVSMITRVCIVDLIKV